MKERMINVGKKITAFALAAVLLTGISVVGTPVENLEVVKAGVPAIVRTGIKSQEGKGSVTLKGGRTELGLGEGDNFYSFAIRNFVNDIKVEASNNHYIIFGGYASYDEADNQRKAHANALVGIESAGVFHVAVPFPSEAEAQAGLSAYPNGRLATWNENRVVVSDGNEKQMVLFAKNHIQFKNLDGLNKVGSKEYRNRIEVARLKSSTVTAISVATMDEYLYGVVPSEMPSSWHIEALKAQSTAARTYAMDTLSKGNHKNDGYDLCDTTHCQVYNGASNESDSTKEAINATSGKVIYYDGKPINAVFSSSNGGYTENSEDAWVGVIPYLRAKKDPYDTTGKVWSRTIAMTDLSNHLKNKGQNIGDVHTVSIEKTESGRVLEIIFEGTAGTHSVSKEPVRSFFNGLGGSSLESCFFSIGGQSTGSTEENPLTHVQSVAGVDVKNLEEMYMLSGDITKAITGKIFAATSSGTTEISGGSGNAIVGQEKVTGDTLHISGKGWGHGVGMSQHGAKGMAEAGHSYIEILEFYYTGVEVR